jgi:hypothetical protein
MTIQYNIPQTLLMTSYWSQSTGFEITKIVLRIQGVQCRPLHLNGKRKRNGEPAISYSQTFIEKFL